ncbi:MAG: FG-GAP-like repeat-containing protein, partial [Acidobacteriota bacterium]
YNANGSLDTSFGTGGRVVTVFFCDCTIQAVAIQSDGKIVTAGYHRLSASWDFLVVRYNTNGSLDTSFGSGGKVLTSFGGSSDEARNLKIQADGKIVATGSNRIGTFPNSISNFALARYNTSGSLDTSFGAGGKVVTSFGDSYGAYEAAVQTDGKIVAVGSGGGYGPNSGFALARYNTDGSLDTSFGTDGKVLAPIGNYLGLAVATQSEGKILAAGSGVDGANAGVAVAKYNTDGSFDNSFGLGGKVVTPFPGLGIHEIAIQSDGKIVAMVPGSRFSPDYEFALFRYLNNPVSPRRALFDFDGDGKTDIGIFRPVGAASEWWINPSSTGQTFALQFGASTDRVAPADYTGDGKADIAFFRPGSGEWYVLRSEDFSFFALPFGTNGDVPVPADYDADAKADFAVFRPSSSTWFISQSSGAPTRILQFGVTGDQPVVADYDGDGKADVGITRPAAGGAEWWIQRSTAGLLAMQFGSATDKAVPGDYTGDGKTDVAFWRPSTGEWFIIRSEDGSFYGFPFGTNGDIPSPGDYDGDGKYDPTVFRPSSATWFIARTTAGTQIVQFGATGDRPLPGAFV